MTTNPRRHSRAPLRRSSAPEKILSAGLAAATCVGIVGVIGVRTIDANDTSSDVPDTDQVVTTIRTTARTDKIGDGKIFVLEVEHAVRVRTGDTDADAL